MTDDLKERLRPPGRSVVSKCDDVDGADLSNVPLTYERIWLQSDGGDGVTWCQHPQDDEDVPYVRADFYAATIARITDLEAKLQRLGRELNLAKYGEPDFAWEIHKNAVADLEARLAAAEAGEWKARAEKAEAERDAALAQVARLQHLIRAASDPDFLWGAMDNVNDMDADITEFANAASRAIRASIPILAAAEKEASP